MTDIGIDVVMRFHDMRRIHELDRAILSLACQSFHDVRAILVAQNMGANEHAKILSVMEKYTKEAFPNFSHKLVDAKVSPGDQRTLLLNIGLRHVTSRFVAFLDADDYVYEDCYEYLISEVIENKAAIAFGNIVVKDVLATDQFVYNVDSRRNMFSGEDFDDLLVTNFCPIHSFVIDRQMVEKADLKFDERLVRLEDYDFLLRICSKYSALFKTRSKFVGVYNWHLDGKNSVMVRTNAIDAAVVKANEDAWVQARRIIWRVKTDIRERLKKIAV